MSLRYASSLSGSLSTKQKWLGWRYATETGAMLRPQRRRHEDVRDTVADITTMHKHLREDLA